MTTPEQNVMLATRGLVRILKCVVMVVIALITGK